MPYVLVACLRGVWCGVWGGEGAPVQLACPQLCQQQRTRVSTPTTEGCPAHLALQPQLGVLPLCNHQPHRPYRHCTAPVRTAAVLPTCVQVYRSYVFKRPAFIEYFNLATPVGELGRLNIGDPRIGGVACCLTVGASVALASCVACGLNIGDFRGGEVWGGGGAV